MTWLRVSRARVRVAVIVAGALLGVIVSLVLTRPDDPSAPYFTNAVAAAAAAAPNASASHPLVVTTARPTQGTEVTWVDRPNHALTPGVVATTDIIAVCNDPKKYVGQFKPKNPLIPPALAAQAFAAYKITPTAKATWALDYLVPLQLGGAQVLANVWPMHLARGEGFHEKEILNIRMHVLVCHNEIRLVDAQKAIAMDWISLWLKYGN